MISFFFLRHGTSEWNQQKRWQGQKDPKLSAEGIEMAAKWGAAVSKSTTFSEIWASDLQRATKTARVIADELGKDIRVDERIRERHLAHWEGLTRKEIDAQWPGAIEKRDFPAEFESDNDILDRALDFIQEKLLNPPEIEASYLVVSHGGLITCLEERLGFEWERLPNLVGRWFFSESPHSIEGISPGERINYLEQ